MNKVIIILFFVISQPYVFAKTLPVIAVMNFSRIKVSRSVAQSVAEIINNELVRSKQFTIVERGQLKKILREQRFVLSGIVSEKDAVKIGELVSAKMIVIGKVILIEDNYLISVEVVDSEKGTILYAQDTIIKKRE